MKMPFRWLLCSAVAALGCAAFEPRPLSAQDAGTAEVHARLAPSTSSVHGTASGVHGMASSVHGTASQTDIPAVIWLRPAGKGSLLFSPAGPYTLIQKHRTFSPHMLVVPVGSVVHFPNADPFFHDVFSLFDGKRFDLGLYEAGTTKEVRFSREGFSYIFCNIHPEMSAVVIALSTPLYAVADGRGEFVLRQAPPGDYDLHVWLEGVEAFALEKLTRRVHLEPGRTDLGVFPLAYTARSTPPHANKFGEPYTPAPKDAYGPGRP